MAENIQVLVNYDTFSKWESVTITRSIDSASGTFSIVVSDTETNFPIKVGDFVIITLNNVDKITGYVDEATASGDSTTHSVQVAGRDNIADLIDSNVPDAVTNLQGPLTLRAFCEIVILNLGDISLTVLDQTGQDNDFPSTEVFKAETGDKCLDYIQNYARKKQVFITPSGNGNMVLFRPGTEEATTPLIHQRNNRDNNIKSWEVSRRNQNRFNKYVCRSKDNFGSDDEADYQALGIARTGEVEDSEIRGSRFLNLSAEQSMTDAQCIERAKEEANIRRARAVEYSCVVAGFAQLDGTPWDIGQKVYVNDEIAEVNGQFIIRSVTYTLNLSSGSTTKISCASIDAYTVQSEPTATDSRKSDSGSKYSRSTPDTTQRFQRD